MTTEYARKRKQTRRKRFTFEMDQVVPGNGLVVLVGPHYPKCTGGIPIDGDAARVYLIQSQLTEESLYEITTLLQFEGLHLDRIPDEATISTSVARRRNISCPAMFEGHQWLSGRPWTDAAPWHSGRCDDHSRTEFDQRAKTLNKTRKCTTPKKANDTTSE